MYVYIGDVSMKKRKESAGDAKNIAVIYARYSSSKQREESIDGQLRVCHAFAENEGLIVMHEYIDRAMSARTDRRPDFLQMIQDSDEKKFSYVIVYQLDRFARSRYDSAIYKHRLKKNGVTVLSANERIANDPTGILLEALIEANAEFYSAELSQKVNRGMMQNVLEGKWPGGRLPLGYELNENRELITNKEQAAMVKKIYEWYIGGLNEAQLIRKLNDEGYRTAAGSKFTHNVLSRILQNRIYIGTFCYRGKDYPNFAPKILTDEHFARAQIRRKQKHVVRSQSADFFLVGKIFCGICGKHIVGTSGTSKTGKRYAYYMCSSRNHILRQKKVCRCSLMTIRKEWLEDKILGVTTRLLNNPDTRAEIARRCAYEQVNQEEDLRVQRLKKELAAVKKKLNNCVKAIEEGFITATVSEKISLYEEEVARLEEQIKKSELLARPVVVTEEFIEYYLQKFYKQKKYDRQQFDLFQTFIHRITVYADYIEIQYKVSNSLKLPEKPVIMRGSGNFSLVDHQGIEPWTP